MYQKKICLDHSASNPNNLVQITTIFFFKSHVLNSCDLQGEINVILNIKVNADEN